MYITSDIHKHAKNLGISSEDKEKLYATAQKLNRFLKSAEQKKTDNKEIDEDYDDR
jgi:hypothetical protein